MKIEITEISKYYTAELRAFLNELGRVAGAINIVEMVTPMNAAYEKQKWLEAAKKGVWTNPSFRYDENLLSKIAKSSAIAKDVIAKMKSAIGTLSNDDVGHALKAIVESRCQEFLTTTSIAYNMLCGSERVVSLGLFSIYGAPSEDTVNEAFSYSDRLKVGNGKIQSDNDNLRNIRERLREMEFDAERIRDSFIWMAEKCGIAGTRPVIIDERATAIDVRDKSSKRAAVVIPMSRKVNGVKLVELTGHEILCHWCDSERASRALPLLGGGNLKPSDEVLYEGHAVLTDYHTHMLLGDKATECQMPYYVIAIVLAINGMSFAEVAKKIYAEIRPTKPSDESALTQTWNTCMRVFRGSSGGEDNQIINYAFMKDRAYFEGRRLAERLHLQQLDSILEFSTLSEKDIEILKPVIEFERKDDSFQRTKILLQNFVCYLLNDKVVF